jgi:phosphatidate cytidylyltransferase
MTRILSALVMAALTLASLWWLPSSGLLVVVLAVAAAAFREWHRMITALGVSVPFWPVLTATLLTCTMVPYPHVSPMFVVWLSVPVTALIVLRSTATGPGTLTSVAVAVLTPLYIGWPLGALVALHAGRGRDAVFLLLATVVASDSAQYYAGRTFGRHPLAPARSPRKTIEGALGSVVVAPLVLMALGRLWAPDVALPMLGLVGIVVVVAGITGDLFESMIKRAASMKDSGTLIPGHGGVLDRIDALLFTTPVLYWVLR